MGHDFGDTTNSVRKVFFARQDRGECAFSKVAVADFAATRSTNATWLANGIARGIVMMHVAAFTVGDFHGIDDLRKRKWGEGDSVKGLGEATSKYG